MWATVHQYSEQDTLMLVYNDFLNDILKGPTHLHFYCQCQRIISQIINGDIVHMHNGRNDRDSRRNLRSQHIKVERVIEIVQRIFTPSTLLSIYEESLKEKKAKELAAEKESKGHNKPGESVSAAFQRNMKSGHNADLSGIGGGATDHKGGLTNDMLKNIQKPGSLHLKILQNILDASKLSFDGDQGFLNAKDLQIQCLFEYEKLKARPSRKKRQGVTDAMIFAQMMSQKMKKK